MSSDRLPRAISSAQYFALSFGGTVGVAWMIILGDLVGQAGPLGAALAMIAGAVMTLPAAFCYAELAGLRPAPGGEMIYAYELYGEVAGYAIGCILALVYVGTCAFEAISVGVIANLLVPGIQGPVLYRLLGEDVHAGGVMIGVLVALGFWALNVGGTGRSARLQEWATYGRLGLMALFLAVAIAYCRPANLTPLFDHRPGVTALNGLLSVIATAPFMFTGFSVSALAMGETAPASSRRNVGRAIVLSVVAALGFYVALILSVSGLTTHARLTAMKLPAAEAFQDALGSPAMVKVVLITAALGNLLAWNSILMGGARIVYAMARGGFLPPALARLDARRSTPSNAIAVVSVIALTSLFLGRGFIAPVVNIISACFGVAYGVAALTVLRLRRTHPQAPRAWSVPGGKAAAWFALASAGVITTLSLAQPWLSNRGAFPAEWLALALTAALAAALWAIGGKTRRATPAADRELRLRGA